VLCYHAAGYGGGPWESFAGGHKIPSYATASENNGTTINAYDKQQHCYAP